MEEFNSFKLQETKSLFYINKIERCRLELTDKIENALIIKGNEDFAKGFIKALESITPDHFNYIPFTFNKLVNQNY